MSNEEKGDSIIRLEERTRSLEKSDKKHFAFELILLLAFLGIVLIFISGCEIKTPTIKSETPIANTKTWVFIAEEDWKESLDGLELIVASDGKSIEVLYNNIDCGTIENSDTVEVKGIRSRIGAIFEETKISIYKYDRNSKEDGEIIGTFELK